MSLISGDQLSKIAILGCGWLGLALGRAFIARGYPVHGTVRQPEKMAALSAAGIVPHLLSIDPAGGREPSPFPADIEDLFICFPPGFRRGSTPEDYLQCIEALCHRFAGFSGRVWYCSSTSVYPALGHFDERATHFSAEPTALALLSAENLLSRYFQDRTIVLRLAGLIGPGRSPAGFFKGAHTYDAGGLTVNLVVLSDVIEAILCLHLLPHPFGIWNLVYPHHPSRAAYYTARAAEAGLRPPLFADAHIPLQRIISADKITRLAGFHFAHPI